jgi:hypothetical protein
MPATYQTSIGTCTGPAANALDHRTPLAAHLAQLFLKFRSRSGFNTANTSRGSYWPYSQMATGGNINEF